MPGSPPCRRLQRDFAANCSIHRPAQDHELLVGLGEVVGDLGRSHGITRIGHHRRPLQQGHDHGCAGTFKRNLGETVFRDLHLGARLLHLPAQVLHLRNGEAQIVSNDHDIGILEDTIEVRDQLLLSRSIHCKLFPVWRPSSRSGTAGCDQPPCPLPYPSPAGGGIGSGPDDTHLILPLRHGRSRAEFQGSNRSRRAKPTALYTVSTRLCGTLSQAQNQPGTRSLGQDRRSHAETTVRLQSMPQALLALRIIPQDVL